MQITRTGIKPCSRCYRARNLVKDGMGRIFQRPATAVAYTDPAGGDYVVDTKTHRVVEAPHYAQDALGVEVYEARGRLINVQTTTVLTTFSRRKKLHVSGAVV